MLQKRPYFTRNPQCSLLLQGSCSTSLLRHQIVFREMGVPFNSGVPTFDLAMSERAGTLLPFPTLFVYVPPWLTCLVSFETSFQLVRPRNSVRESMHSRTAVSITLVIVPRTKLVPRLVLAGHRPFLYRRNYHIFQKSVTPQQYQICIKVIYYIDFDKDSPLESRSFNKK